MKECEGDGDCSARPDAECLGCMLGLSEIEMKTFQRFLEERMDEMRKAGLSRYTIEGIIEAVTV